MKRATLMLAMSAALVGLLATSAMAEEPRGTAAAPGPQAAGEVSFTITAIEASKTGDFDSQLAPIKGKLQKAFKGFSGFKRLSKGTKSAKLGKTATFKLTGRRTLEVEYKAMRDGRIEIATRLNGLKTSARVGNGGMFFLAGRKQGKGVLVVAIQARAE